MPEQSVDVPTCNLCGSTRFTTRGHRVNAICAGCGALERTRILHLFLTRLKVVRPGMRVMHIAPERGLYNYISTIENVRYELFDLNPEKYTFAKVTRLDLVTDLVAMPSRTYDVVMHSHVMEHVLGNVTAVLFHLHRLLKDDGEQFCIIPLMSGHYSEDLGPLPKEERTRRFGQFDHVRRFGREQAKQTVGMLFKLPEDYDLEAIFDPALLDRHNIPAYSRKGLSPDTVLRLKKSDLLLRD